MEKGEYERNGERGMREEWFTSFFWYTLHPSIPAKTVDGRQSGRKRINIFQSSNMTNQGDCLKGVMSVK